MTEETNKKTFVDAVWDFLASIKLAIVLFALIALSSIVGTLLEQNADPQKNLQVIGSMFGEKMAPSLYVFFERLGFMNMFHSWWFTLFLMLFAANLTICSLDRFPRIWKLVKDPIKPLKKEHLQAIPVKREFTLQGKPDSVKEKVRQAASKAGVKLSESEEDGEFQIYGERWRFSRLGVYVTHMSILVILVGAVIGVYFGFKAFVFVPEGSARTFAFIQGGAITQAEENEANTILGALQNNQGNVASTASSLGVDEGRLRSRMKSLGIVPFGFGVRLDNFDVDFYGRSDMAKEYSSQLTVLDSGKEAVKKRIEVNDPLIYKGIYFYQSSYGLTRGSNMSYVFRVASTSGASDVVTVRDGEKFTIPGTSVEAFVTDFNPAIAFDPSGRAFTYADQMNNPAVQLNITEPSGTYPKWIMKRNPATWRLTSGDLIELQEVFGAQQTGLSVRKDPGVWLVYLGCMLMGIGLYIAFFMSHKKLWILLQPTKGSTVVTVAMSANKNREAFERKIDKIISHLREGGK